MNWPSDQRWDEFFRRSQDQLARLAEKARADIAAGRIVNNGFGKL